MTIPIRRSAGLAAGLVALGLAACDDDKPTPAQDAATDARIDAPPPDGAPPDAAPDAAPTDAPPPDAPPPDAAPTGPRTRAVAACGTACSRPLDAVPDARGATVYFTAFLPDGTPAVFRAAVPAEGQGPATPTAVVSGMGLDYPIGITLSADDQTLYIADQSATRGDVEGAGAVFSVPVGGGTLTRVALPDALVHPVSLTVSSDGNDLLVAGQQSVPDMPLRRALYRVPRAGGAGTLVTNDLVDPSGVSQAPSGTIICHDTRRGGARSATAVTVGATGGMATAFAGGLVANYPAGLSYSTDGRSLLFSGADPAVGPGLLTLVGADGRPTATAELSAGMVTPVGLHRARMTDTYAVADEGAGDTGQVFLVTVR